MAHSYEKLKSLTDEELISQYDKDAPYVATGLNFLREELARREHARDTQAMLSLTRQMRTMTAIILLFTVVVTIATMANLYIFLRP